MQTGEGKTLAAVAPVVLNAIQGSGIHVFTFNDYLAQRDAEWMGPIYEFFGISVDFIHEKMLPEMRRKAYKADVTYLTAKEAGFNYLRDSLVIDPKKIVHRSFHMALIDEADSILIDESRIPLVIAGSSNEKFGNPQKLSTIVWNLDPRTHYTIDYMRKTVNLTDDGLTRMEELLDCDNLHNLENLDPSFE